MARPVSDKKGIARLSSSITSNKALVQKIIGFGLSVIFLLIVWWISASVPQLRTSRVIPTPIEVLRYMGQEIAGGGFFGTIAGTLGRVLLAFVISFVLGLGLAIAARASEIVRNFVTPIVTVLRAIPTVGAILVLIVVFRNTGTIAVFIAGLMLFPLLYEGFLTALKEVDKDLLEMAKIHRVSYIRQIWGIFVPSMLPFIFGAMVASVGMGLKVVIAAEIMAIPILGTMGTAMQQASQGLDFGRLFMWIVAAVLVGFLLEGGIRLLGKACMPWKK